MNAVFDKINVYERSNDLLYQDEKDKNKINTKYDGK